ncbi:hypothetical protein HYFRA_00009039 [Hymenoscyphus fraxineus]|uniref:Rhodopsin domain-containing protein n=1 Tax=Hymenoscyphus fraxineus TaxID=746836 RepID=A0A9N9KSQ5_9HELO|nr:hypothetical protein HYFRA_00009039 [Hymenoscyphus fraxineus]
MNDAVQAAVASGKIPQWLAKNITTTENLEYFLEDDSTRLIHVVVALATLEVFFVALFYYSRLRFRTESNLDLWLMIPAFLTCFSHLIICIVFVKSACLGRHIEILTPAQITLFLKLQIAISFLNAAAVVLPKFCILCLYHRVFKPKTYRYAIYFIAVWLGLQWLAHFIAQFSLCTPFEKQWHPKIEGHCKSSFTLWTWLVLPGIISDVMIVLLPLPMIWRLQTNIGQKLGLTATFLTGSIGIITAITRFTKFLQAGNPVVSDLSWIAIDVVLWVTIPPGVYLIAACLPALRPLLVATVKDVNLREKFNNLRQGKMMRTKNVPRDNRPERAITIRLSDNGKFNRLGESGDGDAKRWPSDFSGSNNQALATCFRESTDLGGERGLSRDKGKTKTKEREAETWGALSAIMVQKEYSIRTEPMIVDSGSEYIVSTSVNK